VRTIFSREISTAVEETVGQAAEYAFDIAVSASVATTQSSAFGNVAYTLTATAPGLGRFRGDVRAQRGLTRKSLMPS
jgi:hypothetical protein